MRYFELSEKRPASLGLAVALGRIVTLGAPVVLLSYVAARAWTLMGDFPTGIDPGNWLAFGRALFGGSGKSTPGAYPPLIPAMMQVGQWFAEPMVVAKIIGVGSLVAAVGAMYAIARTALTPWFALAAAALVSLTPPLHETVAFGGYPQNYALAFMLAATALAAHYLASGKPRLAVGAAAALGAAALSHHMYFLMTCAIVATVWLIWASGRPARDVLVRRTCGLAAAGIVSGLVFLPTFLRLRAFGYGPPLNASAFDLASSFRYAFPSMIWLWGGIGAGGILYLALTLRRRTDPAWQMAVALALVPLIAFIATRDPRLAAPFVAGTALAMTMTARDLWLRYRDTPFGAIPVLVVLLPLSVGWPRADPQAGQYYDFYRVADAPLVEAARWIDRNAGDGGVVVRARSGWPEGWWFEGLTGRRIIVGSQLKWLAFPEERDNALLAQEFFRHGRPVGEVVALAEENDIDLIAFHKWEWIGWREWLAAGDPRVSVVYDDGEYMIVDVSNDP